MTASVWNPGGSVIPSTANADNSYISQAFTGTAGQTVFVLTNFQYAPATGSLFVFINGVKQRLTTDFTETSSTVVTLVSGVVVGDIVEIVGLVGTSGATNAAASAAIAEAAALAADTSASLASGYATNSNNSALASSNSATASAASATLASGYKDAAAKSATDAATSAASVLAFKTFSVAGQADIVADSAADTMTIVAGTNVTLTTNAATDTLTIDVASTGPATTNFLAQAANFTVTAAQMGNIVVSTTVAGISMAMPSGLTMGALRIANIRNTGLYGVAVTDFAGNILTVIPSETGSILWASDISTAAGVWANLNGYPDALNKGTINVLTGSNVPSWVTVCPVNIDTAAIFWRDGTANNISGMVLTLQGLTIVAGPITAIYAGINTAYLVATCIDGIKCMLSWRDSTVSGNLFAGACNVTGLGILATFNTISSAFDLGVVVNPSLLTTYQGVIAISRLSNTSALITYPGTASTNFEVATVLVTGTVLSNPSTLNTGQSYFAGPMAVVVMSATRAIVGWFGTGSNFVKCASLSLTGNTINSINAVATINAVGSGGNINLSFVDATRAAISYQSGAGTTLYFAMITLTGTTVAAGTITSITGVGSPQIANVATLNNAKLVFDWEPSGAWNVRSLSYTGTTIADIANIVVSSSASRGYGNICTVGDKALSVHVNLTTNFIEAISFTGAITQ
jgi:hypothetical protein